MRKRSPIWICAFLAALVACAQKIPDDVRYELVERKNVMPGRVDLVIRLNKPVSAEVLGRVATKLRDAEPAKSGNVFMFYYLPESPIKGGFPWATSHYSPKLEVKIQGPSPAEEESLSKFEPKAGQDIAGVWVDRTAFLWGRVVVYREAGRLYLLRTYKDGSGKATEINVNYSPQGVKFEPTAGNKFQLGNYYMLTKDGGLQLWDVDGPGIPARNITFYPLVLH